MPNGFYGSKEEWERMVAPLRQLDPQLGAFAAAHGLTIAENYHNTPNRMLSWSRDGIERLIQISLYDDDKILFSLFAYEDESGRRRGKRWPRLRDISLLEFKANLEALLSEAHRTLETVSLDELEYWT